VSDPDTTRAAARRLLRDPDLSLYAGPVAPDGSFRVFDRDDDAADVARAYLAGLEMDDVRVLRLKAAIAAALPYIETPHVRATLRAAAEDAR
jgi:hypothetical protein